MRKVCFFKSLFFITLQNYVNAKLDKNSSADDIERILKNKT